MDGVDIDQLKKDLRVEAARHANKLIVQISEIVPLPEIAKRVILQEMIYTAMDGYRATARAISERDKDERED